MEYAQNLSFFFKVLEAKTALGEAENKSVVNYYNIIQQSFTVKLYSCNHKLWSNLTNAFLIRCEFSHTIPSDLPQPITPDAERWSSAATPKPKRVRAACLLLSSTYHSNGLELFLAQTKL